MITGIKIISKIMPNAIIINIARICVKAKKNYT